MTPRRKWPWVLVAVVVIAAIIALLVAHFVAPTTPTAGHTHTPPSSTPIAIADPAPTGCLGGPQRNAAMVLSAQKAAPDTSNGAVDFAAAFTRWIQRYPYPTSSEAALVQKDVLAQKSFTSNLVEYLAGKPDLSGGIVPSSETYYMSTVPGVWAVESSSSTKAVVTIGTAFVANGAVSPTLRSSITVTTEWQDGSWHVADVAGTQTTEKLFANGHQFSGGC
jgi:hypothetical protein